MKHFIAVLFLISGCFSAVAQPISAPSQAPSKRPLRVLFLGNSLTFMPEWEHPTVPAFVQALLDSKHFPVQIDKVLAGGHTLENHWKEEKFQDALENNVYDVVFIQPLSIDAMELPPCFKKFGPPDYHPKQKDVTEDPNDQHGPQGREHFLIYAKKMIELVRSKGATPIVVEPWIYDSDHPKLQPDFECRYFPGTQETWYGGSLPEFQRRQDEGYTILHEQTGVEILRIGPMWQKIRSMNSSVVPIKAMYQADHYHPTYVGALLSALMISERITHLPADQFHFCPDKVKPEQEQLLEKITDQYMQSK